MPIYTSDGDVFENATAQAAGAAEPVTGQDKGQEKDIKNLSIPTEEEARSMTHEPERREDFTDRLVQYGRDRLMAGPDFMKDFMEGNVLPEEAGIKGLLAASQAMAGALPMAERGALGIFGGRMSKGAVVTAEGMEAAGIPELKIKTWTGLERGADGMWRKEISDADSVLNLPINKETGKGTGSPFSDGEFTKGTYKLGDVFEHPELYKAYPEFVDKDLHVVNSQKNSRGWYNMENKSITLNSRVLRSDFNKPGAIWNSDPKATLIHELQHAVQDKEGFSLENMTPNMKDRMVGYLLNKHAPERVNQILEEGVTAAEKKDYVGLTHAREKADRLIQAAKEQAYFRQVHETEARNAASRMGLTKEEIANSLGKESEDRPRSEQFIVNKFSGSVSPAFEDKIQLPSEKPPKNLPPEGRPWEPPITGRYGPKGKESKYPPYLKDKDIPLQ